MDSIRQIASGILLGLISIAIVIGGGILATSQNRSDQISSTSTQQGIIIPTEKNLAETPFQSSEGTSQNSLTHLQDLPTIENSPSPTFTELPTLTQQITVNTYTPSPVIIPSIISMPTNTAIIYLTIKPTLQVCIAPTSWVNYFVIVGDTLFSISYKYQVSIIELQQANCLGTSENIFAGTYIKVPNVEPIFPYETSTPYLYPSNTPFYEYPSLTPVPTTIPPDYPVSPTPFSGIG